MIAKGQTIKNANVLVLGITFKENCPDIRNSKVVDVCKELELFGMNVDVYDPFAKEEEVFTEYNIKLISNFKKYEVIVLAVAHTRFCELELEELKSSNNTVVYDIKSFFHRNMVDGRL